MASGEPLRSTLGAAASHVGPTSDARPVTALHVVAGLSPRDGGPSYTVPRLCRALVGNGVVSTLYSVAAEGAVPGETMVDGYRDRRFRWNFMGVPLLGNLRWSRDLVRALNRVAPGVDVVHNHGLWLMPNVQSGRAAARAGKALIITPRGMLSETALAFSRRKKKLFWLLLQRQVVFGAACIHVTSEQEYGEVRAFGLRNPVALIPNGIDLPKLLPSPAIRSSAPRTVLAFGRIHPKKNLSGLVHAWSHIEQEHPEWRLRIVGPSELNHDRELRHLSAALGLRRVSIEGAVYGDAKLDVYREADLFVLPTLNENFGLTVAEALACGIPVISTDGAPWQGLSQQGCGWWIEHGVEPLAAALQIAMALPDSVLKKMGEKGRTWMARDFSWDNVAAQMHDVYRWLARGQAPPVCIRFE